jgi:branched-chain amino acid transport system permease protein
LPIKDDLAFYYFVVAVVAVSTWLTIGLRRGRTARVFIAMRENERAAQAFGIDVSRVRVLAFAVSGFFAGLAGGLIALQQQLIPTELFRPEESIRVLAEAAIGGLNSISGAPLGTALLRAAQWFLPLCRPSTGAPSLRSAEEPASSSW